MEDTVKKEGYMENAKGVLFPIAQVKEIDILRDDVVKKLMTLAKEKSAEIKKFRKHCFDEIETLINISAEKYGLKTGGEKGNVTLMSFDGKYKVIRSFADRITFDERLNIARDLINQCIRGWAGGANSKIVTLVNYAFQTDKDGKLAVHRILGLKKIKIEDEQWKNAMDAITDSINVASSKGYVRFYERIGATDQYRAIPLDIAAD